MSERRPNRWEVDKAIAREVLHNRQTRRRLMANCAFVLLGAFTLGLWVIDKWLTAHPWFFVFWWGGVMLLTLFIILFAMYDISRVIREEKEKDKSR